MPHGLALKMRCELAELRERHRLPPPVVHDEPDLPMAEDCPWFLSGIASDYSVDLDRIRFAPRALTWSPTRLPPLRHRHGTVDVGRIHSLEHSDQGLRIFCTVDDPVAGCCGAFSVCATVLHYTIKDADTPDFYAEIRNARIEEISLTPQPASPCSLVYERWPARNYTREVNVLWAKWIDTMRQLVQHSVTTGVIR